MSDVFINFISLVFANEIVRIYGQEAQPSCDGSCHGHSRSLNVIRNERV